jgi:hypothetical protein
MLRGQAPVDHVDRTGGAAQHAKGGIAERVNMLGAEVLVQHAAKYLPNCVEGKPLLADDHRIPRLDIAGGETRGLGRSRE